MKKISVIVPTYNEEDNVVPLSEAVIGQFTDNLPGYDYELIFIDNDSEDDTRSRIRGLCGSNPKIKAIFNARNYGQFSSPYYGLLQTTGDCAIAICADFQDPVELIPDFVRDWEEGHKIILGQKVSSKESGIKYAMRSMYYNFMKKHSDAEFIEHATGFGLYDRDFIEMLKSIDEPRPFMKGIVAEMGYKIKLIPYEQPKRRSGRSSNGLFGYYDAGVQGITSYTKFGVRLAVFTGVLFTIASIVTAICLGIYKLLNWNTFHIAGLALSVVIFLAVSLQILFIGIVGEYVLEINSRVKKRPLVIESERINF